MAMDLAENDGLTNAMWGSQAGFGQLVKGHAFNIPPVPDVRFGERLSSLWLSHTTLYTRL